MMLCPDPCLMMPLWMDHLRLDHRSTEALTLRERWSLYLDLTVMPALDHHLVIQPSSKWAERRRGLLSAVCKAVGTAGARACAMGPATAGGAKESAAWGMALRRGMQVSA